MAKRTTIVVQSGDMDKLYSALIIANGSLAMGMEVWLFFTFWGLERLKKGGLEKGPLSKMHLLGLGKWMVKQRMKKAKVVDLEKLMADFKDLGGKIIACDMTMDIMGIRPAIRRSPYSFREFTTKTRRHKGLSYNSVAYYEN